MQQQQQRRRQQQTPRRLRRPLERRTRCSCLIDQSVRPTVDVRLLLRLSKIFTQFAHDTGPINRCDERCVLACFSDDQCFGNGFCATEVEPPACKCDRAAVGANCERLRKSQQTALVLSIILGPYGADQFYIGQTSKTTLLRGTNRIERTKCPSRFLRVFFFHRTRHREARAVGLPLSDSVRADNLSAMQQEEQSKRRSTKLLSWQHIRAVLSVLRRVSRRARLVDS